MMRQARKRAVIQPEVVGNGNLALALASSIAAETVNLMFVRRRLSKTALASITTHKIWIGETRLIDNVLCEPPALPIEHSKNHSEKVAKPQQN